MGWGWGGGGRGSGGRKDEGADSSSAQGSSLEGLRAGLAHTVLGIEVRGQSPRPDKTAVWSHSQVALG